MNALNLGLEVTTTKLLHVHDVDKKDPKRVTSWFITQSNYGYVHSKYIPA